MASEASWKPLRQHHQSNLSLPSGSYIYNLCPTGGNAVAAISSDNSLRCFDRQTLTLLPNGVFEDIHPGVTCLSEITGASGESLLATAGRDGTVKLWDLRGGKNAAAAMTFTTDKNAPVTALAACTASHTIVAGTELVSSQAEVLFWDIRSPGQTRLSYVESHNDDVTELQFHPSRSTVLLSGSTDGLVNIYDTTITDEDDALLQVIKHSSIHCAGFLGDNAVYALSHDETFAIHPLNSPDENVVEPAAIQFGDVRPILHSDYVVQVLFGGGGTYIASGKTSGHQLDLTPLVSSPKFHFDQSNIWRLPGAHGQEVVRSVYLDDQSKSIFTCGEDGYVRLWKLDGDDENAAQADSTGVTSSTLASAKSTAPGEEHGATPSALKKHRHKDKKRHKDHRYKPY
ncbi:hypothetical protein AJ80_00047 [Polytolypa hystricis UAMH7299]|uniref:Uncharacterized protein n=1 Tax=Polytolypa hystricis (strain UAMH7299) TaxID=1447883 RepID=A0A2B7Z5M9_POLH7|nr:hypothetical protein AJ80_00047 [Polytolypa hystricis UAMH7299]